MRCLKPALALIAATVALPVMAADYPVLRGTSSPSLPPAPMIQQDASPWEGFYLGGLAGMSSVTFSPQNSGADLAASSVLVRGTEAASLTNILQPANFSSRGVGYGGFLGYNMQFGEAVIGFEADYTALRRGGGSSVPTIGRFRDIGTQRVALDMSAATDARINDLITLRLRAGYAMGNIMPYLTGGLAIGHGQVSTSVNLTRVLTPIVNTSPFVLGTPGAPQTDALSETRRNAAMLGFTGGAGVEALLGGLIVRGEYLFTRVQAQGGVTIDINQARVGAGVKF